MAGAQVVRVAVFRHHLPLVVANGGGAFATRGLRPEWRIVRSSREQRELVQTGEANLAHTAIDNVAAWHTSQHPWAVLRVVDLGLPHKLVARPPLATLADLRGRRIAVDSARAGFVTLLRRIFAEACLAEEVEFVEVGALGQRLEALRRGDVDACLLGAEQLRDALASGARPLTSLNAHFPGYPGLTVTGIATGVAERRAAASRYVGVLTGTARWCFEPPRRDEVVSLVASTLELDETAAARWYEAELARWSGLVDGADAERATLERAWRATGRLAADQSVPAGWYRPDLVDDAASAACAAISS